MILIWADKINKKEINTLFKLIQRKNEITIIFQDNNKFFQGSFTRKQIGNRKNILVYNSEKRKIKNEVLKLLQRKIKKPFFYFEIKKIKRKENLIKKFANEKILMILYLKDKKNYF